VDTRTPVDDNDYQVPFRFTGKIDKQTLECEVFNGWDIPRGRRNIVLE
jgi:hypothetical protein